MGTTNKSTFLQKIKGFFTNSKQAKTVLVTNESVKSVFRTETGIPKGVDAVYRYTVKQRISFFPSWWKRMGITYKTKKLSPVNLQPMKHFGTFSPVKPIWPWIRRIK